MFRGTTRLLAPMIAATAALGGATTATARDADADRQANWRTRHSLELDWVPAGVGANGDDNINYVGNVPVPSLQSDFSHPICRIAGVDGVSAISAGLPAVKLQG